MITLVISLLAIGFSKTAREQIKSAEQFDDRVRAKLAAHSALNEVIFFQLSESVELINDQLDEKLILKKEDLNLFGRPILWREDVEVYVQDLNGLLPQLFPTHPFWRILLGYNGLDESTVDEYLGVWQDMQDPDIQSWMIGNQEPDYLPTGQKYLNGYAQTEHILRWVFADRPELVETLLQFSDIAAPYDTNPMNFPEPLLSIVFDSSLASRMRAARDGFTKKSVLKSLLPVGMESENIYIHNSSKRKISVRVKSGQGYWHESFLVALDATSTPPYSVLRRDAER